MASVFGTQGKTKNGKKRNMGLVYAFLIIYMVVVFGFLFYNMYGTLFDAYCRGLGLDNIYFSMAAVTAVMLGVIGSVLVTQSQLFEAKDNELLMSMPVKPSLILVSRILTLYIWAFFFAAVSSAPALYIYATYAEMSDLSLVIAIGELFFVPLLSLTVSILIAWLLQFFSRFIKNKSIFIIIGTFALLGVYMVAMQKLQDFTNYLASHGETVEKAFKSGLYPFYVMGEAIVNPGLSVLLMLLFTVVPFGILFAVLSATFINLVTTKRGFVHVEYKAGRLTVSSEKAAIEKKEMLHFIKSATYAVNGGTGLICQVGLAVFLIIKGNSLRDMIMSIMGPRGAECTSVLLIVIIASVGLLTEISISSISMEGKSLWVLRTAPVNSADILKAKISAHLKMSLPFALVSGILLNFTVPMNIYERIGAVVLPVLFQAFNAYFGLIVNLRYPKLDWINEAYAVKQSSAAMIGALGSMGVTTMLVIGTFFSGKFMPFDCYLAVLSGLSLIGLILCIIYIPKTGVKRFEEL